MYLTRSVAYPVLSISSTLVLYGLFSGTNKEEEEKSGAASGWTEESEKDDGAKSFVYFIIYFRFW